MIDQYINKIIEGDCIELLKELPDNSVDISFADPPFNLKKKYSKYEDDLEENIYLEWCKEWMFEIVRVTKDSGSIFIHNVPKWSIQFAYYLSSISDFKNWISWKALTGPPNRRNLQPTHYVFLYFAKNLKNNIAYAVRGKHPRCRKCNYLHKDYGGKKSIIHPFGPLLGDVWTDIYRCRHKKTRDSHPCQLPIHLLERMILMSTNEGDIVLDPFIGTGTTGIAAKRLGRQYIGFDNSLEYVEIAKKKIKNEIELSKIDNIYVSYYLEEVVTIRDKDWDSLKQYYTIPELSKDIDHTKSMLKIGSGVKKRKIKDTTKVIINNIVPEIDFSDN
ncbi:MAG: DNA adenine methylase [Clostridiales bacterium]|nr:DNA adenine methylase [Clostridiales bacterium]